MWNRRLVVALLVLVCAWPTLSWAQQEIRSSSKGSSTPLPITGSAVDADHNALDVKCLAGCTGGGGGSGAVQTLSIASGVTTNTSSTPVAGVSGIKNFQWVITGTGAITQTAALKGSFASDGSNAETLCTITLSGTTTTFGTCDPFTAPFPYLFVTTTNTTGTGTSGTGKLGY